MKNLKKIIGPLSLLLLLYIIFSLLAPKRLNWKMELTSYSKAPYGLYVFYHSLPDLFPHKKISNFRKNFYFLNHGEKQTPENLIIINNFLKVGESSVKELMKYISGGATVFYCSKNINRPLLDTLNIKQSDRYFSQNNKHSPDIDGRAFSPVDSVYFTGRFAPWFYRIDSCRFPVKKAGFMDQTEPNFLEINIGKGRLLLHSNPEVFTNYYLLRGHINPYVERLMATLPDRDVLWFEGNSYETGKSILSDFLNNNYFKGAYLLFFLLVVLFATTEFWRTQRVVPLIATLRNTSLHLVDSVARLYFRKNNNRSIAEKMIRHFTDEVHQRYHLSIAIADEENMERLRVKAGRSIDDKVKLMRLLKYFEQHQQLTNDQLMDLYHSIEKFKTK